jgi:hypothetical protein
MSQDKRESVDASAMSKAAESAWGSQDTIDYRLAVFTESDGHPQPAATVPLEEVLSSSSSLDPDAGIDNWMKVIDEEMRDAGMVIKKWTPCDSSAGSGTDPQKLLEVRKEEQPDEKKKRRKLIKVASYIVEMPLPRGTQTIGQSLRSCAQLDKTRFLTTRQRVENYISPGSSSIALNGRAARDIKTRISTESVGGLLELSSIDGSPLDSQADSQFD